MATLTKLSLYQHDKGLYLGNSQESVDALVLCANTSRDTHNLSHKALTVELFRVVTHGSIMGRIMSVFGWAKKFNINGESVYVNTTSLAKLALRVSVIRCDPSLSAEAFKDQLLKGVGHLPPDKDINQEAFDEFVKRVKDSSSLDHFFRFS